MAGLLAHDGSKVSYDLIKCHPFPNLVSVQWVSCDDMNLSSAANGHYRRLQLRGQPKHYTSFPFDPNKGTITVSTAYRKLKGMDIGARHRSHSAIYITVLSEIGR